MTNTPIAADVFQPGDVLGNLATELTLDDVVFVHEGSQPGQLILMKILRDPLGINPGFVAQLAGHPRANAVEVLERIKRLLLRRNVDAEETGHGGVLPLG